MPVREDEGRIGAIHMMARRSPRFNRMLKLTMIDGYFL
jgi:hypothetical protein